VASGFEPLNRGFAGRSGTFDQTAPTATILRLAIVGRGKVRAKSESRSKAMVGPALRLEPDSPVRIGLEERSHAPRGTLSVLRRRSGSVSNPERYRISKGGAKKSSVSTTGSTATAREFSVLALQGCSGCRSE
jgi:hypothetical protein